MRWKASTTANDENMSRPSLALLLAGLTLMLLGAGSAVIQGMAFPRSEASGGVLLLVFVVTCLFYCGGSIILLIPRTVAALAWFYGFSAIVATVLLGITLSNAFSPESGVSGVEFLALGSYQILLALFMMSILLDVHRMGIQE